MPSKIVTNRQQGVVVFAKNKRKVSAFYAATLELDTLESDSGHDLLVGNGYEIVVHTIPRKLAAEIKIAKPPEPRFDTPFKPTFVVKNLEKVRQACEATGGYLKPAAGVWKIEDSTSLTGGILKAMSSSSNSQLKPDMSVLRRHYDKAPWA